MRSAPRPPHPAPAPAPASGEARAGGPGPGRYLALALGLLCGLGLAELAARIYFDARLRRSLVPLTEVRPLLRYSPELFWELRPGARLDLPPLGRCPGSPARINAQGYRTPTLARAKPACTFRLLSLGESSTFGVCVAEQRTYSAQLQRLLNARADGWRYEVFNAGVPGYTTHQAAAQTRRLWPALRPDLLLLYFEGNDRMPSDSRHLGGAMMDAGLDLTDRQLARALARGSSWAGRALHGLLRRSRALMLLRLGRHGSVRVPEADRRQNLTEMAAVARAGGGKVVLLDPAYDPRRAPDQAASCPPGAADLRVDLARARDQSRIPPRDFYADPMHPTAAGHAVFARAILRALEQGGLLPAGPCRPPGGR